MTTLYMFQRSHYNEKARWALALKGVAYERKIMLPGPHGGQIKKLTGQTATPVLELDGKHIAGTHAIIEALEAQYPAPQLIPTDPTEKEQAMGLVAWFDDVVGVKVRTAFFAAAQNELGFIARVFSEGQPLMQRLVYRAALPLVKPIMLKANGVTDQAAVDDALAVTRQALDFIADETKDRRYLVGGRFTVADLTAASLLAITTRLPHADMKQPEPLPKVMEEWFAQWEDHPATDWVQSIFAEHRPT